MKALPPDAVAYRRSAEFSEATVPAALLRRHTTKPGVWGRICVLAGRLRYRVLEPQREEDGLAVREEHVLSPECPGVVEPEVPHEVAPLGAVRFYVEFLRRPG